MLFWVELGSLFEITLYNAKEIENSKEDTYSSERLLEPTEIKVGNTLEPKKSINKKEDKNIKKEVKVYSANKEHHIKDNSRIEREFVLDFDDDEYDAVTVSYSNTDGIQIEEQDIVTQKKDKKVKISFESKNSKLKDKHKDVRNIQEERVSIDIEMWKDDAIAQKEKQDVWVLSTPYGDFISDVDQIINKRNYNKYLLENGIIDEATYEDLDREFHCYSDSLDTTMNEVSVGTEARAMSTSTAATLYADYVEIKYGIR